ncbi:dihydroorotate dehydrogenase (quinone) [Niastella koreensis]|uniref:Dihydroorotate dehydrogenase (quinone) n=2 Tax=Niastella koreensis TaxID=354356 RepID=G8TJS1_NIAKG|nr:quinone-dependent dihydroorotate dehydrogenase [Niastella koreensis]AEW01819.1 Dihydroorotate dehydrogenase [Niastella koreensis GR20-10]OQP48528.1 dihydroorotate dehydrogenase (quinone) [Niastella koreensis]
MYNLLRRLLFCFPTESVHHFSMNMMKMGCSVGPIRKSISNSFSPANGSLSKELFGLRFKNPVGLAAGFDKNALYLTELEALGFGFVEIGTVTPKPQAGNDKPRLFRLPKDKALINRMGFNNDGVQVVAQRLKDWRERQAESHNSQAESKSSSASNADSHSRFTFHDSRLIIGGNIGKNKVTPNEDAWKDYEICFRALFDCVDYFVVNVSSPNTPGLRELQEKDSLRKILSHLQTINQQESSEETGRKPKPILLKIAPDLTPQQIDDVIDLALEIKLDGLVATNTTISRDQLQTTGQELEAIGAGGLSGAPVRKRATEIVRYIHEKTNGQIPVIASGGIFTAADAKEKLAAGASLVQVWTGFIYEGPGIVKNICNGLTAS